MKECLEAANKHTILHDDMFFTWKYLQKIRSKKIYKKQFKILEKDLSVTPNEIPEPFVGNSGALTMNGDE